MFTFREANSDDVVKYFNWANDQAVRNNAINKSKILIEDHIKWFNKKIEDPKAIMLLFYEAKQIIGQLRIDCIAAEAEAIVDFSVDKNYRGKGYGTKMLCDGFCYFSKLRKNMKLVGFVKTENIASQSAFKKAGFVQEADTVIINNEHYIKFFKSA